jgi:hypothetical protein
MVHILKTGFLLDFLLRSTAESSHAVISQCEKQTSTQNKWMNGSKPSDYIFWTLGDEHEFTLITTIDLLSVQPGYQEPQFHPPSPHKRVTQRGSCDTADSPKFRSSVRRKTALNCWQWRLWESTVGDKTNFYKFVNLRKHHELKP